MFGNPETTPGGRALKFYASVRLDVRGNTQIKGSGDQKIAISVKKLKSKWLKTKLRHHLKQLKLKLCMVKEFHVRVSLLRLLAT